MNILRPVKFLPEGKEGNGLMLWVIAVMVFLMVLAMAFGMAVQNATQNWTADLDHQLTIQITNPDATERQRQQENALAALKTTPGIISARGLNKQELRALLEPWLGAGNVTDDLPVPAMIAVVLDPKLSINLDALRARIKAVAPDADLDDHQQWIGQLVTLAETIELAALSAAILIALATMAIVVFASQARLSSWNDIIEIVHQLGATDSTISGEFRYRFLIWGFKGSLLGFLLGLATLYGISNIAKAMGEGIIPEMGLSSTQTIILSLTPFVIALLSMITADITVKRSLQQSK
jgi:cell division transport system permease protein